MSLAKWKWEVIEFIWSYQPETNRMTCRDTCRVMSSMYIHYSKKLKEHVDIMIFIERYPLKRCQGCVKLIAGTCKVNCFLNITDLSEVQLCMSSNSWTWECPHTKDGADHVPLILLSSVCLLHSVFIFNSWSNLFNGKCCYYVFSYDLWQVYCKIAMR